MYNNLKKIIGLSIARTTYLHASSQKRILIPILNIQKVSYVSCYGGVNGEKNVNIRSGGMI